MYENILQGIGGILQSRAFMKQKTSFVARWAIIINHPPFMERAEIIREKGTNRARFFRNKWISTPGLIGALVMGCPYWRLIFLANFKSK